MRVPPTKHVTAAVLAHLVTWPDCLARSGNVSASRAEGWADVFLRDPGPWDTMGHLLHMPSHTFQRIGRYHDGVLSNVAAYEADRQDSRNCRLPYAPGAHAGGRVQ